MKKRIQAVVSFAAVLSFALACTNAPTNLNTNSAGTANKGHPAAHQSVVGR
jgi:ABC-type phosphate/phosphonate transport system substrate-binding protein